MWPFGVVEADPLVDEEPGLLSQKKLLKEDRPARLAQTYDAAFSISESESRGTGGGNIGLSGRFWFHVPPGGVR